MAALRCPMLRGTSSAVMKLSNLLLLLNQSRGKHKIDARFRWKELIVFKVNPLSAMTASHQSRLAREVQSFHTGSEVSFSTPAGGVAVSIGQLDSTTAGKRADTAVDTRGIGIAPTAKPLKPATVPYYDTDTRSVVQIRRKKPMAELRTQLSNKK